VPFGQGRRGQEVAAVASEVNHVPTRLLALMVMGQIREARSAGRRPSARLSAIETTISAGDAIAKSIAGMVEHHGAATGRSDPRAANSLGIHPQ
jgi:hypothetical protein